MDFLAQNQKGTAQRAVPFPQSDLTPWRVKFPGYGLDGQRTLEPETMLMSLAEMTAPFTRPGLSLIFRSGARIVPSTTAAQHPTPPPPPEKETSEPVAKLIASPWDCVGNCLAQ